MKAKCIVWIVTAVMLAYFAIGYDYEIDLNRSALPYNGNIIIDANASINSTIYIEYSDFLSGPASVRFINTTEQQLNISISVPYETNTTDFTGIINTTVNSPSNTSSSRSYSVHFVIREDIVFALTTEKDYCFAGEPYFIDISAPAGSMLDMNISSLTSNRHYAMQLNSSNRISYAPKSSGHYTITASVSFRNHSDNFQKNFSVYNVLSCGIEVNTEVLVNQSIRFNEVITGGIGKKAYAWDFGDGGQSSTESPMHKYNSNGTYRAKLKVEDEKHYRANCYADIRVDNRKYQVIVEIRDNETGNVVGDANVSMNGILKKSNVNGRASFYDVEAGDYKIEISRQDYDIVSNDVSVSDDIVLHINISKTPEDKRPVPQIEVLYPKNNLSLEKDTIIFEFDAKSSTPINNCILLFNEVGLLGYKVRGRIDEPKSEKVYSMPINLTNGMFKWMILCENSYGKSTSQERYIDVSGLKQSAPTLKADAEEEQVQESNIQPDVKEFDQLISWITSFKKEIDSSGADKKDVFHILGYDKTLSEQNTRLKKLRQDIIDLSGLSVSEADRKRKRTEIMSELYGIKSKMPRDIRITEQSNYIINSDENDIKDAVDEYLKWKNYSLSKSRYNRYVKKVTEAQNSINVSADARTAEIEYMDGNISEFGIVSKKIDIADDVAGEILLESIPKSIAGSVDKLKFSAQYEIVNRDPVVRIFSNRGKRFSYYVTGKTTVDELKKTASVIVLDMNNPKNSITGFSILSNDLGSGRLLLTLSLLSIVLIGNYIIFLRDSSSRQRFLEGLRNIKTNIRPKSGREKLLLLLDSVIDMLNLDQTELALGDYAAIISLYEKMDDDFKTELKPVMAHLHYELELYNLNRQIDHTYSRMLNRSLQDPTEILREIKYTIDNMPEYYRKRISSRLKNINISMEIRKLKQLNSTNAQANRGESIIEDSLYGVDG